VSPHHSLLATVAEAPRSGCFRHRGRSAAMSQRRPRMLVETFGPVNGPSAGLAQMSWCRCGCWRSTARRTRHRGLLHGRSGSPARNRHFDRLDREREYQPIPGALRSRGSRNDRPAYREARRGRSPTRLAPRRARPSSRVGWRRGSRCRCRRTRTRPSRAPGRATSAGRRRSWLSSTKARQGRAAPDTDLGRALRRLR
jgi:hypothetical protein